VRKSVAYARKIALTIVILIVVVVGVGIGYTWYVGQQTPAPTAIAPPLEATPVKVVTKPKVDLKAPVSASVQSLSTPVAPGDNAAITVRSSLESTCKILVEYNKVASKDSGLIEKKVDEFGMVSWSWKVEESVPLGKWPVEVTCTRAKNSAVTKEDLEVKKRSDITQ
jgi:hypothetical protein